MEGEACSKISRSTGEPADKVLQDLQETYDGRRISYASSLSQVGGKDGRISKGAGSSFEEHTNPAHWFVENLVFKAIVACCIFLNVIMIGIEVDTQDWGGWKFVNHIFAALFMIETIMKLIVLRLEYFADRWNWLDCILGLMGFVDTWVMTMLQQGDAGMKRFTILRVLQLVRLVRVAKVIKSCRKLLLVLKSIVDAIQTTFWVTFVAAICIYVCSVFCVEMIGHAPSNTYPGYSRDIGVIDQQEVMANFNPDLAFGNMVNAMFTLFNVAFFAEWDDVVRPLFTKQPEMVIFFIAFAIFVCFGIMNVIVGMMFDTIMANARLMGEEENYCLKKAKLIMLEDLQHLIFKIDSDNDGKVDKAELEQCLQREEIHRVMDRVKLPYKLSANEFLSILDNNGDGVLEYEEFLKTFYRLLNSDNFQQMCMLQMGINDIKSNVRDVLSTMTNRLDKIELGLQGLSRSSESSRHIGVSQAMMKVAGVQEPNPWPQDDQSCLGKVQLEFNELLNTLRLDDRFSHGAVEGEDTQKRHSDVRKDAQKRHFRHSDVKKDEDVRSTAAPPSKLAPHSAENIPDRKETEYDLPLIRSL